MQSIDRDTGCCRCKNFAAGEISRAPCKQALLHMVRLQSDKNGNHCSLTGFRFRVVLNHVSMHA